MVAGIEQAAVLIVEHQMSRGVARGLDGLESRPAGESNRPGREPRVRHLPVAAIHPLMRHRAGDQPGQVGRAEAAQPVDLGRERATVGTLEDLQRRALSEPEFHAGSEVPPDRHGLRVVVTVHMGDQEPNDVGRAGAETAQTGDENLA